MQPVEPFIESDALGAQGGDETLPAQPKRGLVELKSHLVITRRRVWTAVDEASQPERLKLPAQLLNTLAALAISFVQLAQLGQQYRGLKLGEGADVISAKLVTFGALMNVRMIRQHRSATAAGQQLRSPEAQDADVAPRARFPAFDRRSRHLGRVFDHRDTMLARGCRHLTHGHSPAVQM